MTKYSYAKLKSPNLFLFFAIVLSSIVLFIVGAHTYNVMENVLENSEHSQKIRSNIVNIHYIDEVLSSSTILAVSTGDTQWEKRYHLYEAKLDSAINELIRMDSLHTFHQRLHMTDSANVHLSAMEHRVFELVHLGKHDEASAIILGSDYARLKAIYSEGLSSFINLHTHETDQLHMRQHNAAIYSKWSFVLVILLLAIVWLLIVRFFRKSRAQILRQNQELELQIAERKINEHKIEELKTNLELILNAVGEGIYGLDNNGNTTFVNKVFEDIIGVKSEEIIGKPMHPLIHHTKADGSSYPQEQCPICLTINEGKIIKDDNEYFLRKDGSGFFIEYVSTPILKDDKVNGAVVIFKDITERRLAEDAIFKSKEQYRLLVESASDIIFTSATDSTFISLNSAFETLLSRRPDEWIGKSFASLIHPDDLLRVIDIFNRAMQGETPPVFESRLLTKQGNYLFFEFIIKLVIENNVIKGIMGISRHITERKLAEEKLKESEEKYRILAESSPEMIYLIDTNGYVTYMNKVAAAQLRAPAQELIGKHLKDIFPPDVAQQNHLNIQNVIATKSSFQHEIEIAFPAGSRWLDSRLTPVFDEKDQVTGVLGLSYDITGRRQAEEKMNLLAQAVKNSGEAIAITDKDYNIIYVNDFFCEMCGYKEEEIIGQPIAVIDSQKNLPEVINDLYITLEKKKRWAGEILYTRKDGSDFPVQLSLATLLDDKGEMNSVIGVLRDITERKQMEMELRESESRAKAMYQAIPDMMFRLNRQGVFLDYKAESKDLYTQSNQNIIGSRIQDIFPAEFADLIDRQICASLDTKTLQTFEYKLPLPVLGVRDYEARMIVSGTDEVTAMVRDITDRKLVEEEIKLKNEELQKLNIEKDKFFSIIAHDLRGPLGGIMGLTDMIADESNQFTPDQKKNMSLTLRHSARNIFNLLENLLEWSQMQKGNIEFNPQLHVLKEVVNHCMKTIEELARKKHIEIIVNISNEQVVFVDTNMLQTIIRNLASNAIKFTSKGGNVTITGVEEDNTVIFSVKDTGIGMSAEMRDNLFKLDVNTGRKGTDGEPSTGLGLLLCKEFVEKHGGSLWVESEVGKGSVFYFKLPFLKIAKENVFVDNVVSKDRPADQIKSLKILIAEDDETSDMLLTIALRNISRDLLHAKTGVEAIDICRNNPDIDLLLMDIKMPAMDGYEATRQIRLFNKDIVIIAQTAFAFLGEKEKSIEAGCNDYISKPIDSVSLLGLVQKHFKIKQN